MVIGARTDITKQEVVSQELATAIVLFFCDDDAISIHVLASAASQILYDVCKHKGLTSVRDIWRDYVVEEHQKDWVNLMRQAFEYFKHAKKDAFTELERFDPRSNEWVLFNACVDYRSAYSMEKEPFVNSSYLTWFFATHEYIMRKDRPLAEIITTSQLFKELREKSPEEQRQWMAEMLRRTYEHLDQRPPVTGLRTDPLDIGLVDSTVRRIIEYT